MEAIEALTCPFQFIFLGEEALWVSVTESELYTKAPQLAFNPPLSPIAVLLALDEQAGEAFVVYQAYGYCTIYLMRDNGLFEALSLKALHKLCSRAVSIIDKTLGALPSFLELLIEAFWAIRRRLRLLFHLNPRV